MSSAPLRLVLIEDDRAVVKRVEGMIAKSEDVVLAAVFGDAESAAAKLLGAPPLEADVAVVDLKLPGMSGIELIRRLSAERERLEAIVLTTAEDDDSVFEALKAGASGYLVKTEGIATLKESLDVLLRGGSPMSPVIARRVIEGFRGERGSERGGERGAERGTAPKPDAGPLTDREGEVLARLARGASYGSIGRELGIGIGTVQSHIKAIYKKLGIHSRGEAVREAYRRRLR